MKKQTNLLLAMAVMLFARQFSFAGATEDLWAALKGANYPKALTAIAAGADVKSLDPAFGTPLNFASCWADIEVVKALIDAKSEVNFIAPANGQSPLMNAASWGNIEAVKLLLALGANTKIKNKPGQTLLAVGITSTKLDIVKILVDAGADPNEKFSLGTVKDLTLMNSLIAAYAPKEKVENIKSIGTNLAKMGVVYSPRLLNAKESDFSSLEDMAKYLLEKGADPNQKVAGTWGSIVFQAAELGKTGVVKALLAAKVDIETKGNYVVKLGYFPVTLLEIGAIKGNNELVEMLCKAGASVNHISVFVKTDVKSDTYSTYSLTTTEQQTAVSLAHETNHPETVELLRKYGGLGPQEIKK